MAKSEAGRTTVEFLLQRGRLEVIIGRDLALAADALLGRAQRRLLTARAGLAGEDAEGAFAASYDAYRMAAEALLLRQGLRATGGDGSHVTVEDAVSAQFAGVVTQFAKPTFERLRRGRHAAQYFDPDAPEITSEDAAWALSVGSTAVGAVVELLRLAPPRPWT